MRPNKIISGGQTGADQAGLFAGRDLGIETGGWAPKGWRTDDGPAPWLESYGLKQHKSPAYPPRTKANVWEADGTVGFGDMKSPGMRLTQKHCREAGRPFIANPTPEALCQWMTDNKIQVLNVSGNRERTHPGIGDSVYATLGAALF